jgi:hypothetical protein
MRRIKRRNVQTAHISLQIISISKSRKTKTYDRANQLAQPAATSSNSPEPFQSIAAPFRSFPTVFVSVRQLLGITNDGRKQKNHQHRHFSVSSNVYWETFRNTVKNQAHLTKGKPRSNPQISQNKPESPQDSLHNRLGKPNKTHKINPHHSE